jgi:signal transduction histidine kinase/HD-like signal output (HDOD) protein
MDAKTIIESLQLPTLSKSPFEILEVEEENSVSFLDDIKKIVEREPLLSAHVLKVANSSFYRFSRKPHTISHAIGLLGGRKIRNMAFSFSIFDFLKKVDYNAEFVAVFRLILKKSLLNSSIAASLAKKVNYPDWEELYVSGLLADIGQLILFLHSPETYCKLYSVTDRKLIEAETEAFGIDHVTMGTAFCDHYNLPEFFKNAVDFHAELKSDEEHCKIAFIADRIAELLLKKEDDEKDVLFNEIENHAKKLLRLSLPEVEETIKQIPVILETFTADFPEMQKDLHKIIDAGSTLIITLMKKQMDMVSFYTELADSQNKQAKEKMFLAHMLNLSYFFSSLMTPRRLISSLIDYFGSLIREFTIEFIYGEPGKRIYFLITSKENIDGIPFDITSYPSLVKSKIFNEPVRLDEKEMKRQGKKDTLITLVFPISYHTNFFGFMLLSVEKENYLLFDVEISYVQMLSNIIANSFQNYLSFEELQKETDKKKLVTRELLKFDRELNHSRESLIELQKTEILGELMPVIFHKLKNKLTPILGYSQILLAKVEDSGIRERLEKIEKNANELADQLNTLREYLKTDKLKEEKENLNTVLSRMKPYFSSIEKEKGIKLVVNTDRTIPDDLLNPGQLEALITNIVENAVHAINEKGGSGGAITITTRNQPDNGHYYLIVKDNGIGLKQEDIHRIWTPFYSDFSDRPGIGLTLCEKVISNHNAVCDVRTKEGEFSEFEIRFKRKLEEDVPEVIELEAPPLPRKNIYGKILIVDDEAYLLDLMKEILLSEGNFDVITTVSGKDAVQMIDESFDLVITDIRMPGINGMDIYDFMKSKNMEAKIIVVTADPNSEDVAAFLKENNIEYLKKPFELMKFKQHVMEKLS